MEITKETIDVLSSADTYEVFLKHGFSVSRAINPFPVFDVFLGVTSQALIDIGNPYLTPEQRIMRATIVGFESGITGVV